MSSSANGLHKGAGSKYCHLIPDANIFSEPSKTREGSDSPSRRIAPIGPLLGPSHPTTEGVESPLPADGDSSPQSPHSMDRGVLRDLTLPTVPSYDIPSSPPGSPVASTNAKFKHFLDLKKQGVHFNDRLAKSVALKNPSLMQKLMDFSEIDDAGQYVTTLANEVWDPNGFPESSSKEELSKCQQKILRQREERSKGSINFVSASANNDSSKLGQKSAAERIMAGLDRGRSNSPQIQGVKRKTRFEN